MAAHAVAGMSLATAVNEAAAVTGEVLEVIETVGTVIVVGREAAEIMIMIAVHESKMMRDVRADEVVNMIMNGKRADHLHGQDGIRMMKRGHPMVTKTKRL
jgi:hypothetical protein